MIEEKLPEIPKDWATATISELIDNNEFLLMELGMLEEVGK